MERKHDFIVESNGLCFICLKQNMNLPQKLDYLKSKSDYAGLPNFPIYSLQSLSRFLQMDLKKVLKKQSYIDPHLLSNVQQSALKVELCDECSNLMGKFSKLNQQLEKIRMEVMSSVIAIHEKLIDSNTEDVSEEVNKIPDGWTDKLDILKNLRFQAIEKGSRLINSSAPWIKVENLAMNEVSVEQVKQKSKVGVEVVQSASSYKPCHGAGTHEIQIGNIKIECLIENQDDNIICYGDDHTSSEPNEEEPIVTEMKVDVHQFKQTTNRSYDCKEMNGAIPSVSQPRKSSILSAKNLVFSPVKANGKYRCNICNMQYKSRNAASQHHDRAHLKIRYECEICNKVFVRRDAYDGHYRAVHLGDDDLTCNKCNRGFTSKSNLERHQLMGSCASPRPLKPYICQFCDSGYSRNSRLNEHVKTVHLKALKNECNQCAKVFSRSDSLKKHIDVVHNGLRRHRCNACAKTFSAKVGLDHHKDKAHGLPRPGSQRT